MKQGIAGIEKMPDIVLAFYNKKDHNDLLDFILMKMMEITNADGGTLYVTEGETLHFRIMRTISINCFKSAADKIDLPPISLDENNISNVSAYSAIKNEIVNIADVYDDSRFNFSGPKNYDRLTGYRTRSMLVFPLTVNSGENEEVIGVIQLINSIDRETGEVAPFEYNEYGLRFLRALSNISSNTLSNVKQASEIKELFHSFVRVMTKAIDERSPFSINHTNQVAKYCGDFASYLGRTFPKGHKYHFDGDRTEKLVMAALLHDIGKIITPPEIMDKPTKLSDRLEAVRFKFQIRRHQLMIDHITKIISKQQYESSLETLKNAQELIEAANTANFLEDDDFEKIKGLAGLTYRDENGLDAPILDDYDVSALTIRNGTLTDDERKVMQEHVSVTGRLLDQMSFNKYHKEIRVWAKNHHEFLDGSGYPLGLSGDMISVETSILSIMDIYDALTARDRPYKKMAPPAKALEILTTMAEEGKLNGELLKLFIDSRIWEIKTDTERSFN